MSAHKLKVLELKTNLDQVNMRFPGFTEAYFALAKLEKIEVDKDNVPSQHGYGKKFGVFANNLKFSPAESLDNFGMSVETVPEIEWGVEPRYYLSVSDEFKELLSKIEAPEKKHTDVHEQKSSSSWLSGLIDMVKPSSYVGKQ